jgi:hypothetical protein
MAFCARNSIFIRRLSPQVTETVLRQTFAQCDQVDRLLFRSFPGRTAEIYAQLDFRTSKGVIEGHKMSGTPILGVPCEITLRDPGVGDTMDQIARSQLDQTLALEDIEVPSEPQGVQLEHMKKFKESVEEKRLRTLHVAGLEKGVTEERVRAICGSFGALEALRLDEDEQGEPFALLEFKDKGPATAVKLNQRFEVDGRVLTFTEAKTLVDTCTFAEQNVHFENSALDPSNVKALMAFQHNLEPKLAKARAAAAEIMKEPLPQAVEEALAPKAPEPEPYAWSGRSELDLRREIRGSDRSARRSRGRRTRRRSHSKSKASRADGRGPSRGAKRGPSRGKRRQHHRGPRKRGPMAGSLSRSQSRARHRHRRAAKALGSERICAQPMEALASEERAIDLDDEEIAVVPNTELMVLGESSSYTYSSEDEEDVGPKVRIVVSSFVEDLPEADVTAPSGWNPEQVVEISLEEPQGDAPREKCSEEKIKGESAAVLRVAATLTPEVVHSPPPQSAGAAELVHTDAMPLSSAEVACSAAPLSPSEPSKPSGLGPAKVAENGNQDRKGPPKAKAAICPVVEQDGDLALSRWDCAVCGEANKSSRSHCNNCGTAAPWVRLQEKEALSSDESASPPSPPHCIAESPPGSVADVADSPARSVAGSSGHCVSESPSPERKVAEVDQILADEDDILELSETEEVKKPLDCECELEAMRLRGEIADARARIFHPG